MFTQQFNPALFATQAEFIRVMDAKRDFVWWADELVTEETKELKKADEQNEGMEQIFKEMADLAYVICGFYNCMPIHPDWIVSEEIMNRLEGILEEAAKTISHVSQKYSIPLQFLDMAFKVVHDSNMSKLDENGQPIRREDGKILKGPNYVAPDMSEVVAHHAQFLKDLEKPTEN